MDIEEYILEKAISETKKQTNYSVRLYNDVMTTYCSTKGKDFKELKDIILEDLPNNLSKFFIIAKKKSGEFYNASSLKTCFQAFARFLASSDFHSPVDIKKDV